MYIFYDFETSDKDFLGQILSYYFVLVDEDFNPLQDCGGLIKPNRMECPRGQALAVNRLSLQECLNHGQSEFEAANRIYQFIQGITNEYNKVPLVGFNSARFDFKHYEKLLLKYGLSPTFYSNISSLDIYEYCKYLATTYPTTFPIPTTTKDSHTYTTFKLESLANAFNCLDTPQTHDAKSDVLLTLSLTQKLNQQFQPSLKAFYTQQANIHLQPHHTFTEPFIAYEYNAKSPIDQHEWLVLGSVSKQTVILLNTASYNTLHIQSIADVQPCLKYLNTRTHFINHSQPIDASNHPILNSPYIKTIQQNIHQYFDLFPNDWDIEYRPWAMGFQCIEQLRNLIESLIHDPNRYPSIIQTWQTNNQILPADQKIKHRHMITLFNRFYLNYHPNPNPTHIQKYIQNRYINGHMFRNPSDFLSPQADRLQTLKTLTNTTDVHLQQVLKEHEEYTQRFIQSYLSS